MRLSSSQSLCLVLIEVLGSIIESPRNVSFRPTIIYHPVFVLFVWVEFSLISSSSGCDVYGVRSRLGCLHLFQVFSSPSLLPNVKFIYLFHMIL